MAGFLLIALFTASAVLAVASIAVSLHRYAPAALRLKRQLRECPEWRELRWSVTEIQVRTTGAEILRPDFRPRAAVPGQRPALRAAA